MSRKIVFIDIDGTLVTDAGNVPESTRIACQKARENGHLLYLCTGRSKAEIYPFILEMGFDGIIGAGGGFLESQGEMLFHQKVPNEAVVHMVDYFNATGTDYYLESNGGLFASPNLRPHLEQCVYGDTPPEKRVPHPFIEGLIFGEENLYRSDINKACFLENPKLTFEEIVKEFENEFQIIHCTVPLFGKDSGELAVPGVSKKKAITHLLEHLGADWSDTVAIGDGNNDIEMVSDCAFGIAMENGTEKLKAAADFVTGHVENDGFYNGFVKAGLL